MASLSVNGALQPKESPERLGPVKTNFGTDQGWASQAQQPRYTADIDGDGKGDFLGIMDQVIYVSKGSQDFADFVATPIADIPAIAAAINQGGQVSFGDIDGDGDDEFLLWFEDGRIVHHNLCKI